MTRKTTTSTEVKNRWNAKTYKRYLDSIRNGVGFGFELPSATQIDDARYAEIAKQDIVIVLRRTRERAAAEHETWFHNSPITCSNTAQIANIRNSFKLYNPQSKPFETQANLANYARPQLTKHSNVPFRSIFQQTRR